MLRLLRNSLVIAAALFSGAQLPLLQMVAWTGMLVGNLWQHDAAEAVTRTFDGKHPCALCAFVKEAESQPTENKSVPVAKVRVLDLVPIGVEKVRLEGPAMARARFLDHREDAPARHDAPLLEPPRAGSC